MLSAVPNFFIDPSGHCDSLEIKEHIISEVIETLHAKSKHLVWNVSAYLQSLADADTFMFMWQ